MQMLPDSLEPDEQEAFAFVMSWPWKERQEIINWLAGALVGHGTFLSPKAQELLDAFRVQFPDML